MGGGLVAVAGFFRLVEATMKWWLGALGVWGLLIVAGFFLWSTWPSSRLRVVFCDVGQGDAILISRGNTQVLIDGGPDEAVLSCLAEQLPIGDLQLELVIATHPDADHIGGLPAVFHRYDVAAVMLPAVGKSTQLFWDFRAALLEEKLRGMKVIWSDQQTQFSLGPDVTLQTWALPPELTAPEMFEATETELSALFATQESTIDNYNDLSIAVFIHFNHYSALLTGDLEKVGELALLESGLLKPITTLKAGHHGSNSSTSTLLLEKTRPEHVVVSCGQNNRYGHPDQATLDRIQTLTNQIWRTDLQGTIKLETDGEKYWIRTSGRLSRLP